MYETESCSLIKNHTLTLVPTRGRESTVILFMTSYKKLNVKTLSHPLKNIIEKMHARDS